MFATNPAVLKGSIGKQNAEKIVKCVQQAIDTDSPLIGILDTSGARFSEGIEAMEGYSKIIGAFSQAYGTVPVVCVVKGNDFGLSAYLTGICDLCVAYDKGVIATSSPLLLAADTKLDAAKVGTAAVHAQQSGLVAQIVKSDKELKTVLTQYLDLVCQPVTECKDDENRVCASLKAGTKAAAVITAAFDKDSFLPLRPEFAKEVTTGLARLGGVSVGVVAVEGKLTANGAIKINELLSSCEGFGMPVVNLVDCNGAENNLAAENTLLIREIANMLYSYNVMHVAKISVVMGNAIGLGYTAFASRSVCDYTVAWANAQINTISDAAAANLLFADEIAKAKDKEKAAAKSAEAYGAENSDALVVARKGFIDTVIDPALTRQYLIAAVQMYLAKR